MAEPLLRLEGVGKDYPHPSGRGVLRALDRVSLALEAGQALGVAGQSGAGKSTLARLILGLEAPTEGRILWKGRDLAGLGRRRRRRLRRQVQIVWQDPFVYLNPYETVRDLIAEPMEVLGTASGRKLEERTYALLDLVGLPIHCLKARPHELSGGQCQRVAIARALAPEPELLICDEALSSLDSAQQAAVLKLLAQLRKRSAMSYLFISHDLASLAWLCPRIAVLKAGRVLEQGPTAAILTHPAHPYTQALIEASFWPPHPVQHLPD